MYKTLAFVILLFVSTFTSLAQSTDKPSSRNQPPVAFDSRRGKLVLFGGIDQSGKFLDDTWEWDGSRWEKRAVVPASYVRAATGITYDTNRGKVVVFGGQFGSTEFSDTIEWDGSAWVSMSAAKSPPARVAH